MARSAASPAPAVWLIGAGQWPRAALRAELLERGYETVGFAGVAEALAALEASGSDPAARPRLLLVDLQGLNLGPGAAGALARTGLPVMLVGTAADLAAPAVAALRPVAILAIPVSLGAIAGRVEALLSRSPHRAGLSHQ